MTLRGKSNTKPTTGQMTALRGVENGAVHLFNGCRAYPSFIAGVSLNACERRGWVQWEGSRMVLTDKGWEVLR